MTIGGYKLGVRVIVLSIITLMLIVALSFGITQCASKKTAEKQAEVSTEQSNASTHAGAEALNTVGNVMTNDAATDAQVAAGQAEIAAAAKGQKGTAAKKAACRLKAYRDTPQCKEPAQ